ncbi:hypothetical protein NDU88_000135 [Pleurodeles waltl]|uniref:Uncharacterized protein n=1 Tax=Pleurodeles waltl TaxID=8319 RepID=A0AAV7SW19_PLEWA|nr:hypothetical protein NDU88_000135 [Pleurodeles waltl]
MPRAQHSLCQRGLLGRSPVGVVRPLGPGAGAIRTRGGPGIQSLEPGGRRGYRGHTQPASQTPRCSVCARQVPHPVLHQVSVCPSLPTEGSKSVSLFRAQCLAVPTAWYPAVPTDRPSPGCVPSGPYRRVRVQALCAQRCLPDCASLALCAQQNADPGAQQCPLDQSQVLCAQQCP